MMGKDRTDLYDNGIMQQNVKHNIKMSKEYIYHLVYMILLCKWNQLM